MKQTINNLINKLKHIHMIIPMQMNDVDADVKSEYNKIVGNEEL